METKEQTWQALQQLQQQLSNRRIESFFQPGQDRYNNFSVSAAGLTLDYSKNLLDEQGLQLLLKLAERCDVRPAIESLFRGDRVNTSEQRAALHTALRSRGKGQPEKIKNSILKCQQRVAELVKNIHSGRWAGSAGKPITDVINIGIGGSDLGPAMACLALRPYDRHKLRIHFVSNLDGTHIAEKIVGLDPATTLFIVASKSFTTLETRKNAESAREWLFANGIGKAQLKHHFVAVSSNIDAAVEFGIARENVYPVWDWVGGRYSIWSAVGLALAMQIGNENFERFLDGAADMDEHFRSAELRHNMPAVLALLSIWYINFFNAEAQLVIPYDHHLNRFPKFLQQLEMESNGKSVQKDGSPVTYQTMGAIFGEAGSNTQHSFHQLLLQGTRMFPVDFIIPAKSHYPISDHHTLLLANCIAQSRALMKGKTLEEVTKELQQQGMPPGDIEKLAPHKVVAGNKPSNIIMMDMLTPYTLGALVALYEHKVYVQSVIWNINAFDQWGVELGKQLSSDIYQSLSSGIRQPFDDSTSALIAYFQQHRKNT